MTRARLNPTLPGILVVFLLTLASTWAIADCCHVTIGAQSSRIVGRA